MTCYGYAVWILKRDEKRKLVALEMNLLGSSANIDIDYKQFQTPPH